jgi:hypothetical protein
MKLTRSDFDWAVSKELITAEQSSALWTALSERTAGNAKFDFAHLAYYAGAVIVILAMGWFLALNWKLGATGIFIIAAIYGSLFWLTGRHLWKKPETKTPGGLLATLGVCMVPVMTYAVQGMMGLWPNHDPYWYGWNHTWQGNWIVVHTVTVLAGLLAIQYVRFPFIMAPISWSLWLIAMDATGEDWQSRMNISILYGVTMLMVAYGIDLRRIQHRDFAFWLYLFGSMSLFGGLVGTGKGELQEFIHAVIFVVMMVVSVLLQRKALMVFGALGFIGYLFHLSWSVFHDSPVFPLVLTAMGVGVIGLGVFIQKYKESLKRAIFSSIPSGLREFLPQQG